MANQKIFEGRLTMEEARRLDNEFCGGECKIVSRGLNYFSRNVLIFKTGLGEILFQTVY